MFVAITVELFVAITVELLLVELFITTGVTIAPDEEEESDELKILGAPPITPKPNSKPNVKAISPRIPQRAQQQGTQQEAFIAGSISGANFLVNCPEA